MLYRVLLCSMALLGCHCFALADTREPPQQQVNFAVQYYPPFTIENDANKGMLIELLEHFASRSPYQVNYHSSAERRSTAEIENGTADIRMESKKWYRGNQEMCWSSPLYHIKDVYVSHHSVTEIEHDKLNQQLFLARFGYTYPDLEPQLLSGSLERKNYYSELDILSVLSHGRSAAAMFSVIGLPTLTWYQSQHPKLKESIKVHSVSDTAPLQLQFGHSAIAKQVCRDFNAFFAEFKKTAQFQQILLKYGLSIKGVGQ